MDDDYGADDELLAAMAAADPAPVARPTPAKIQQPTPQRLDKAPPSASSAGKVVQPTPQALPKKQSGSTILVSPRQRGNPVLTSIRSMPWEYSDIPADYVLGLGTCALFLSLKYHRLHPEYIYTRIRNLQGKYNLRILLTMVDIPNHEASLKELSKTSLINNVTLILCWSAAEAARYIELYKSYENATFGAIKGQQPSSYGEKLVEFVTVPRSLNKSDAVAVVSNFGSLRNAINADAEQLGMLNGWGGIKVKKWVNAVDEPFRVKKAAKRGAKASERTARLDQALPLSRVPLRDMPAATAAVASSSRQPAGEETSSEKPNDQAPKQFQFMDDSDDEDDEEAMLAAAIEASKKTAQTEEASRTSQADKDEQLSGGIAAALAKLRDKD
ncbi:ssDNA endonuclease and repair protein rad10 [Fusarium irregulare]|uniref:SsDNA endonuclease and repair protein rad10 n=1 Tax=Fusarium irregulare TaxID=2494466 RepID=A0A9W8UAY5_9HYPO|nr:ssDNA endonuclease and repair protein rad10 [Fusarium irregulare]KAJ4015682.1 ssDNA endonuclease and repair protein rad10 [Fusarium irregulare]